MIVVGIFRTRDPMYKPMFAEFRAGAPLPLQLPLHEYAPAFFVSRNIFVILAVLDNTEQSKVAVL